MTTWLLILWCCTLGMVAIPGIATEKDCVELGKEIAKHHMALRLEQNRKCIPYNAR